MLHKYYDGICISRTVNKPEVLSINFCYFAFFQSEGNQNYAQIITYVYIEYLPSSSTSSK